MGNSCVLAQFSLVYWNAVRALAGFVEVFLVSFVPALALLSHFPAREFPSPGIEGHLVAHKGFAIGLLSVLPKSLVLKLAFRVIELSIAIAVVVIKISLILPPVVPCIHSIASLLVIGVVTAISFEPILVGEPNSISASLSLLEVSLVRALVGPDVLAVALRHAVYVLSSVIIAVSVVLHSFSVLQAVFEHSSEEVASDLLMDSLSVRQSAPPLPLIVLDVFIRFGVARREAEPVEASTPMLFVIMKLADVEVAIGVYLNAIATLLIIVEVSFVKLAISLQVNAPALSPLAIHLAEVDLVIALYQLQFCTSQQLLDC